MAPPSVIIVGAGAGGLATAARLRKQGSKVKVIEKNDSVGGRCSLIYQDGYRFDQGPSLVLMPEVFVETFNDLGTSLEQEKIQMLKCNPNYRVWFADHDIVEMSTDLAQLKQQVEKHEGPDSFPRLCAFLEEAGRYYHLSMKYVLHRNFPSLFSIFKPDVLVSLLQMRPWTNVYARVSGYFNSDKMRRAWTFAAMYMGMSPYTAPGTYTLLQYIETVDSIWYPRGGFQVIMQAIADIGRRLGVEYRLNSSVESVIVSNGNKNSAQGVRLASGEELYADAVVINADLVYAYNELLPPSPSAHALKRRPTSCSSISFFWAFDRPLPELNSHNIFLAEKYRESFDDIFDRYSIPEDPSFYVNVPTRVDPTAAPPGKETVIVLVPVGHLTSTNRHLIKSWERTVSRISEFVLNTIECRTGLKDLRSKIVSEKYETPFTWESKFNLDRGAILGLSHSFMNVLSLRPQTKHPSIDHLYFVGASTHPGTGVPVCLAGGKLVAEQITDDYRKAETGWTTGYSGIVTAIAAFMAVLLSWMLTLREGNNMFGYIVQV